MDTAIKQLSLTAENEKIYVSYKKKGQENKVRKTGNQNTAHFEDSKLKRQTVMSEKEMN